MRVVFAVTVCSVFLTGCIRQQQSLSILNIFQTTVNEPNGTKLVVFIESGGVATPLLPFTVGNEKPTLFIQTGLPGDKMQVAIATSSAGFRQVASDLSGENGNNFHVYGKRRQGASFILMETTGSNPTPPNRIYIAPASTP